MEFIASAYSIHKRLSTRRARPSMQIIDERPLDAYRGTRQAGFVQRYDSTARTGECCTRPSTRAWRLLRATSRRDL